jgi:tetratricopeptide (TPR) repeat protein
MKKVLLLFTAVFVTVFSFAQEQNASELVEKANASVESKDYEKAVELFESVLAIPDNGQDAENIKNILSQLKPIVAKEKAKDAVEAKDYEKAIELYKAAMEEFSNDESIADAAGVSFYNEGIKNYKSEAYIEAAKCFTISEKEFNYDKAEKYKKASLNKVAEGLAAQGKTEVGDIELCKENKDLLTESLANVYVKEGNEHYKAGTAILIAANEKVGAGSMTTVDEAYTKEVDKAKSELKKAVEVLGKAKELDATNANAKALIDACNAQLSALQ